MTSLRWLIPILSLSVVACANQPGATPDPRGPDVGQVRVELVGKDRVGQEYRLRNAQFEISSYGYYNGGFGGNTVEGSGTGTSSAGGATGTSSTIIVSSETALNDAVLSTTVVPGQYYVTLDNGWYLEKITPGGAQLVQQSVLLSDTTQYAYVYNGGEADVVYRFGVDGTLIDFRHGDININVEIEHPGDPPPTGGAGGSYGGSTGTAGFGGISGSTEKGGASGAAGAGVVIF